MPVEAVDKDLSDQGCGTVKVEHENGSHRLKYFAMSAVPAGSFLPRSANRGPHLQPPGADIIEDGGLELHEFPLETRRRDPLGDALGPVPAVRGQLVAAGAKLTSDDRTSPGRRDTPEPFGWTASLGAAPIGARETGAIHRRRGPIRNGCTWQTVRLSGAHFR